MVLCRMDTNQRNGSYAIGMTKRRAHAHGAISDRARAIWHQRGRPDESDLAIWLEAEKQVFGLSDQPQRSIQDQLRESYPPIERHRSATSL